jgi:hypothetical protein
LTRKRSDIDPTDHSGIPLHPFQHAQDVLQAWMKTAADLRRAFPDMTGLSPRSLKYMRAFGEAWPDEAIVQAPLAQIT